MQIEAESDGIYCNEDIEINGGKLNINAGDDGIRADGITVNNGTINITAKADDGFDAYCGGITIKKGSIKINSDDNSLSSNGDVSISGGEIELTSEGDEGI